MLLPIKTRFSNQYGITFEDIIYKILRVLIDINDDWCLKAEGLDINLITKSS